MFPIGVVMGQNQPFVDCYEEVGHPFGYSFFAEILPYIEQSATFNAINFFVPAGGHPPNSAFRGLSAALINRTGLLTQVNSYICPSDPGQSPFPFAVSPNPYAQSSYAGMAGTFDIWHWYCGCPPGPPFGGSCPNANTVYPTSDGVFGEDLAYRLQSITDGTSNTIAVGEFARFINDPDAIFNTWSRCLWFGSSFPNSSRPEGLASSVPKINAAFLAGDVGLETWSLAPTGDVNSWLYLQSGMDGRQWGQFGFRSQHPGGANFLFCDGSVKFLKDAIDTGSPNYTPPNVNYGVYRSLSTRSGGEVISADQY
jgi:prepilin-type processing-associated H-X9-DG protein